MKVATPAFTAALKGGKDGVAQLGFRQVDRVVIAPAIRRSHIQRSAWRRPAPVRGLRDQSPWKPRTCAAAIADPR